MSRPCHTTLPCWKRGGGLVSSGNSRTHLGSCFRRNTSWNRLAHVLLRKEEPSAALILPHEPDGFDCPLSGAMVGQPRHMNGTNGHPSGGLLRAALMEH